MNKNTGNVQGSTIKNTKVMTKTHTNLKTAYSKFFAEPLKQDLRINLPSNINDYSSGVSSPLSKRAIFDNRPFSPKLQDQMRIATESSDVKNNTFEQKLYSFTSRNSTNPNIDISKRLIQISEKSPQGKIKEETPKSSTPLTQYNFYQKKASNAHETKSKMIDDLPKKMSIPTDSNLPVFPFNNDLHKSPISSTHKLSNQVILQRANTHRTYETESARVKELSPKTSNINEGIPQSPDKIKLISKNSQMNSPHSNYMPLRPHSPRENNQYQDLLSILEKKNLEIARLHDENGQLKGALKLLTDENIQLRKMKKVVADKDREIKDLNINLREAIKESEDIKNSIMSLDENRSKSNLKVMMSKLKKMTDNPEKLDSLIKQKTDSRVSNTIIPQSLSQNNGTETIENDVNKNFLQKNHSSNFDDLIAREEDSSYFQHIKQSIVTTKVSAARKIKPSNLKIGKFTEINNSGTIEILPSSARPTIDSTVDMTKGDVNHGKSSKNSESGYSHRKVDSTEKSTSILIRNYQNKEANTKNFIQLLNSEHLDIGNSLQQLKLRVKNTLEKYRSSVNLQKKRESNN